MDFAVREQWLAQVDEEIIDPDRAIVDPHHHFFASRRSFQAYDLAALRRDTASHGVIKTVYLQCGEGHLRDGPKHLRPVGETRWVDQIAAEARKNPDLTQIGAMIATAELRLGGAVREVLEAHQAASKLFRGIRQAAAWDASDAGLLQGDVQNAELYRDPAFRAGFAILVEMGLSFDAWHYHHQTPYLTELAREFPDAVIVLDHFGTPIGVGPYAGRKKEVFAQWAADLADLASCPNVSIKLGGLAMPWTGFGFETRDLPPTSDEIVAAQAPYYGHAIDVFGTQRSMFESNFPVDKLSVSYAVLWNAFKKMARQYSEAERDDLFRGTATRIYGL
jgi:L-fuconolactonase